MADPVSRCQRTERRPREQHALALEGALEVGEQASVGTHGARRLPARQRKRRKRAW
jgi:hypothetical protein